MKFNGPSGISGVYGGRLPPTFLTRAHAAQIFLAVICHLHGRLPPFYLEAGLSLDKFQDSNYIDFDFNYGLLTYFQLRRAALVRPCLTRPLSKMAVICYVGGRLPPKNLRGVYGGYQK